MGILNGHKLLKGYHAIACGPDALDAPMVKHTQPASLDSAFFRARMAARSRTNLIAVRARGSRRWTLFKGWKPVLTHQDIDVIRMRAALMDV